MKDAEAGLELSIDLNTQTVVGGNRKSYKFEVEPFRKKCLLNGLDDIGLTLEFETKISAFEGGQKSTQPWLYAAE